MTEPMTLKDADALGRQHGYDIAESILIETPDIEEEEFGDALADVQENFRSYSPFEFYAAAINARAQGEKWDESERGWDRYDEGFDRGVRIACRERGRPDLISTTVNAVAVRVTSASDLF